MKLDFKFWDCFNVLECLTSLISLLSGYSYHDLTAVWGDFADISISDLLSNARKCTSDFVLRAELWKSGTENLTDDFLTDGFHLSETVCQTFRTHSPLSRVMTEDWYPVILVFYVVACFFDGSANCLPQRPLPVLEGNPEHNETEHRATHKQDFVSGLYVSVSLCWMVSNSGTRRGGRGKILLTLCGAVEI